METENIQEIVKDFLCQTYDKVTETETEKSPVQQQDQILNEKQTNIEQNAQNPESTNDLEDKKNNSNLLMDFSNLFKKKPRKKKKTTQPKENKENNQPTNTENTNNEEQGKLSDEKLTMLDEEDPEKPEKEVIIVEPTIIDNEVPRNLTITQEEMKQRRYLDQRRWFCLSRCQYKRSCGISSLTSVWNYLFSTLGTGDLPPISQEEALIQLGVCKERDRYFGDIEFGSFTGNQTLIKWFRLLCKIYNVQGRAFIMWKNSGEGKTPGVDADFALEKLKDGLRSENNGFIYHAHDHYFCPMGFEVTTTRPMDAYKKIEDVNENELEPWIFIGEPSKCYPCFHIKKWKDVVKDLTMGNPYYYSIRRPDKGVMERKGATFQPGGKKFGTTINCLIQFQKVVKREKKVIVKEKEIEIEEKPQIQEVKTTIIENNNSESDRLEENTTEGEIKANDKENSQDSEVNQEVIEKENPQN